VHFAHFGDIGHLLNDKDMATLGKVDIIFIPVGGKETIEPSQSALLVNQLDPRIVFPMHYKTELLGDGPLCEHPLSDFTDRMSNVEDAATTAVEVELARLPAQTKVVCLRHG
jgi:L-ascorbate metabolism protein UlaG (beta-lactamase superfamily)